MEDGQKTEKRAGSEARLRRILAIGFALIVFLCVLFLPQAFNLRVANPSLKTKWLLLVLSTLCFIASIILIFVLARQVLKLLAERRANVLGSRFKTKLVISALALSLTPVVCMFAFSYGLINRTLDKWFSEPVVTVRDDTQSALDLVTQYVEANATHEAISIGDNPEVEYGVRAGDWALVHQALELHRPTLEGGFVRFLDSHQRSLYTFSSTAGPTESPGLQYVYKSAPIGSPTTTRDEVRPQRSGTQVEVAMPIPAGVTAKIKLLASDTARYTQLAQERHRLRWLYILCLLLITMAILFAATWVALFLSKTVTVPIAELASATQEIARGNLAYRVRTRMPPGPPDEVGALVRDFNRMASDLENGRSIIDASRQELQRANQELQARRRYMEALLESIPSAVLSLDRDFSIVRTNSALLRMFHAAQTTHAAQSGDDPQPRRLEDLFDQSSRLAIRHLIRKAERWPSATGQVEAATTGRVLTLAVTAAAVPDAATSDRPGRRRWAGYVLVLEDLTDLLRIQRTAAWREVAQRVAHEIKNPLTPIALSAQRIRRRVDGGLDNGSAAVVAECAATIESEVHSLQRLVDEFSAFARFPHSQKVPCDLNEVMEKALRAFDGRLDGIEIHTELERLPMLQLDPEDMRRVFINLLDNAAEAMRSSPYRRITLATRCQEGTVEAVVADTGHGLPASDKQRLFLPYYSTKERGTGLGLAIVARIIEENGGAIRVEDNIPLGARFIVELPLPEAAEVA